MATKKNQSLTEDLEFLTKNSKVLLEQAMESNKETISKAISDSLVDDESEGSEFEMGELEGSTEGGEDLEGSNEEMEGMEQDMEDEESEMDDDMSNEGDDEGEKSDEDDEEFGEEDEEDMEDEESEMDDEEETEIKESKVIDMRKASPKMLKETWEKMSEEDEFEVVKEDDYGFEEDDEFEMENDSDFSDLDLDGLDFEEMEDEEDLDEQVETGYGEMHEDEDMGEFEKMFFNKEEDYSDEDMDLDEEMIHEVGRSYANLRNQRVDQFNTPAKKYSAHRFRPAVRESKEYVTLKEKYVTLKKENDVLKEQLSKSKEAILETQDNLKKVSRLTALAHYAKELFYEHTTSKKERAYIIESLEKTQTLEEAKETYKKLNEEFTHKALMTESKNTNRDVLKEAEEKLIKESGSTSSSGLVKETVAYEDYEDSSLKRMKDLIHYKGKK
jgi:hypothetical protein